MSAIPYTKIDVQNTAVDAASYVNSTWIAGGDQNQKFSLLGIELSIATQAILYKVLSTSSDGTSPFATIALNTGAAIPVNAAHGFDTFAKASVFMNFQFSATTTCQEFFVVERMRW